MQIELDGTLVALHGDDNSVTAALRAALQANGAMLDGDGGPRVPDILIVSLPLLPRDGVDSVPLLAVARSAGEAMMSRGNGRIVFLVSAAAGMPMRRHPDFSVQMAAVLAAMRILAMRLGPKILVNAVGVGAVGEPLVAGDAAMLGHASVKRPGAIAEVVDTVLFFCDPLNTYATGQLLSIDGGWSVGYGRNF